jgi:hypothetical protein
LDVRAIKAVSRPLLKCPAYHAKLQGKPRTPLPFQLPELKQIAIFLGDPILPVASIGALLWDFSEWLS